MIPQPKNRPRTQIQISMPDDVVARGAVRIEAPIALIRAVGRVLAANASPYTTDGALAGELAAVILEEVQVR